MLPHLHIQNFRQFRDLKIDGLRRLNLIVGENGVGKSSVLEAVWLLCCKGEPEVVLDILSLRGELARKGLYAEAPKDYARSPFSTLTPWPPVGRSRSLEFIIDGRDHEATGWENLVKISIQFSNYAAGTISFRLERKGDLYSSSPESINRAIQHDTMSEGRLFQSKRGDCVYVPVSGLDAYFVHEFWDRINLTESEDDIDLAVQLLEPDIQRISMSSTGPVVKLKGGPAPVPLRRLGEGMTRLFALALAMVNAKGGVLLIDEIETGLHRATLNRMWPFLFTLAERLDVQLFATTHSWDCISSFAAAAKVTPEDDAALIRLERKGNDIVAVHYDEKTLAIATEQGIEVR